MDELHFTDYIKKPIISILCQIEKKYQSTSIDLSLKKITSKEQNHILMSQYCTTKELHFADQI